MPAKDRAEAGSSQSFCLNVGRELRYDFEDVRRPRRMYRTRRWSLVTESRRRLSPASIDCAAVLVTIEQSIERNDVTEARERIASALMHSEQLCSLLLNFLEQALIFERTFSNLILSDEPVAKPIRTGKLPQPASKWRIQS